jgi:hypothetical protein
VSIERAGGAEIRRRGITANQESVGAEDLFRELGLIEKLIERT